MTNQEFIQFVGSIARRDWLKRKIMLPSVVIAQAILESGWGTTELAVNAMALFGIKKNGWTGRVYIKAAAEQRPDGSYYIVDNTEWRAYDSWEDSVIDHNDYIATRERSVGVLRYKDIIGNTDYKAVSQLLKDCGYATNLTYPEKLINLIEKYDLTQYDEESEQTVGKLKIAISAGHGLYTAGKRCDKRFDANETREWTLNSRIANKLQELLKAYNCEVLRVDDTTGLTDVGNTTRADKSDKWGADIYISIHHNAGKNGRNGGGIEVYYSSSKAERKTQAWNLYNSLIAYTGLIGDRTSRVIKKGFTEIKKADAPSFLIENGYMDSPDDVPVILSEAHADNTAKAIVCFLVNDFGLTKTETQAEVVEPDKVIYKVQCGAFSVKGNAQALVSKLKADGYEAVIVSG